jgi:hypothetical protein
MDGTVADTTSLVTADKVGLIIEFNSPDETF